VEVGFPPFYENASPRPGEDTAPVWTPFAGRLAQTQVTRLTSAGLYLGSSQAPFDLEGERGRPEGGDPSWRLLISRFLLSSMLGAHDILTTRLGPPGGIRCSS
jgi:hypothetical protein